jgi:hypothetical protein
VACALEFTAEQCADDHWKRALEGGKEGRHYRFRCPVCGVARALEVTVKGESIAYRCWHKPACDKERLRAELADLLPCWKGRKPRRAAPDRDELVALLLDKSLPPNALRVAMLRALGMPEAQIRAKLKLPKRTYYDAVQILSSRPRW